MLRARKVAVTIVATNANPISSLDNYIAPSAFIFYLIAKHTCDCVTCSDYSQRFVNRGYADNDWLMETQLPLHLIIIPFMRCKINFNPVHFSLHSNCITEKY